MLNGDVFAGKVTKNFGAEKGFKGQLDLADGGHIFLLVKYNGKVATSLIEAVEQTVILEGDLRFPDKEAKSKIPVLEVRSMVNGGGSVVKYGRLTRDAELAYTPKGKQYCKFGIATNYGFGRRKETDFINAVIWGNDKEKNQAVILAEKGAKGREILVHGKLQINQNDEGKVYTTLVVSDYLLLGAVKQKQNEQSEDDSWDGIGVQIDEQDEIPF